MRPSINMSQATSAPCTTTARTAPTAPTLVGPALQTPAHTQDSTSFTNACLDNYLDLLHQEPRYADSGTDYAYPTLLFRPCVDCGTQTGCFCDYCRAQERMPDMQWGPGQATPLCTLCDGMRGACHYCLDIYCVLAPHSGQQHTAHAPPAGQADDKSGDGTPSSSGSSTASSHARPGESESAFELRQRQGTPAPEPRWPLSELRSRAPTLGRRERQ